jgi:long-chain acyl-CoA synthetase
MDPIWLKSYPSNIPNTINYKGETLQDLFFSSCEKFATHPAYTFLYRTLNYAEFKTYAEHFASFCQHELKLAKGERLAVMLPNMLHYPITIFGALLAGLVVVNLNPLDKAPALKHELADSGATVLVVLENFIHELIPILAETHVKHIIVASSGDLQPWPKNLFINIYLRYIKHAVRTFHLPQHIRFLETLKKGSNYPFKATNISAQDLAFLQYTGGTTGSPKGTMLSHQNLMSNLLQCYLWVREDLIEGSEIIITALPLYHIFSLMVNVLVFFKLGGLSVLIADARDLPELIKTLKTIKFTCINGVNTLFNGLLHQPEFQKLDFSSLKMTMGGGMAIQQKIADDWQNLTHCVITQGYGLTEASPVVCINPVKAKKFIGSIGLPVPSTEIAIRDHEDQDLPIGEIGELCISGPQVMQGYWHNEAETQHVLSATGWLKTGDAAYIDKQGFVYLVDRIKDMIIVSGFKVFPNEIENLLKTLPGVNEVAVIGVPDEQHGEIVKALIVKEVQSELDAQAVIKFCRERLIAYKVPHQVEFVASLPKSAVGKILKKDLRPLRTNSTIKQNLSQTDTKP